MQSIFEVIQRCTHRFKWDLPLPQDGTPHSQVQVNHPLGYMVRLVGDILGMHLFVQIERRIVEPQSVVSVGILQHLRHIDTVRTGRGSGADVAVARALQLQLGQDWQRLVTVLGIQ